MRVRVRVGRGGGGGGAVALYRLSRNPPPRAHPHDLTGSPCDGLDPDASKINTDTHHTSGMER